MSEASRRVGVPTHLSVPRRQVRRGSGANAARAAARTAVFIFKMMPVRVRPIDWVTHRPLVEPVQVPTAAGPLEAEVYRPPTRGRHPGVVLSFGVLPAGVVDPRVAMLGEAFARAGFAALLHWSPSAREQRLDPDDIPLLVTAYEALVGQPYVDQRRSGFMGVCIGGSFGLIAAADPAIRDRVAFVAAHSPYSSLWTLATDIASGTRTLGDTREPWEVDPLTWQVYVRSVTDWLPQADAVRLRGAFERRIAWNATKTVIVRSPVGAVDPADLSPDGRAVLRLLAAGADDIEDALRALPPAAAALLTTMSPTSYVDDLAAPLVLLIHDREDHVIPVGESRRLATAMSERPGVHYTEMGLRHLRIPRGWSPLRVAREMAKGYTAWYPLFRAITA